MAEVNDNDWSMPWEEKGQQSATAEEKDQQSVVVEEKDQKMVIFSEDFAGNQVYMDRGGNIRSTNETQGLLIKGTWINVHHPEIEFRIQGSPCKHHTNLMLCYKNPSHECTLLRFEFEVDAQKTSDGLNAVLRQMALSRDEEIA